MTFELDRIVFSYGGASDFRLSNLTLAFASASVIGLAGANGSGKTTLVKVLLRQIVDYTGEYRIDGSRVTDNAGNLMSRYRIGYAPDTSVLDDILTGQEILELVGEIRGMSRAALAAELETFARLLQIGPWLSQMPCGEYSAGMRRKVSAAIAFLGNRQFAILDEPLNGLDPLAVIGLRELIVLKRGQGVGCLVSSHILDFIQKTCDRVMLLKDGGCLYEGATSELILRHGGLPLDEIYVRLFGAAGARP